MCFRWQPTPLSPPPGEDPPLLHPPQSILLCCVLPGVPLMLMLLLLLLLAVVVFIGRLVPPSLPMGGGFCFRKTATTTHRPSQPSQWRCVCAYNAFCLRFLRGAAPFPLCLSIGVGDLIRFFFCESSPCSPPFPSVLLCLFVLCVCVCVSSDVLPVRSAGDMCACHDARRQGIFVYSARAGTRGRVSN